jgi:hypothetical protein
MSKRSIRDYENQTEEGTTTFLRILIIAQRFGALHSAKSRCRG